MDILTIVVFGVLGVAVLLMVWNWLRAWRTERREEKIRRLR